jgi:hypothetical protein
VHQCHWPTRLPCLWQDVGIQHFYASYLPLGIRLHCLSLETARPLAFKPVEQLTPHRSADQQTEPAHKWEAWEEHPAFVDDVGRWWPSNELPPIEPPPSTEDHHPDIPAPVVYRQDTGGLLNFWV